MWPFKCKHPFDSLIVEREQTIGKIDDDFEEVIYYLHCWQCHQVLQLAHAKCINGTSAFFDRKDREIGEINGTIHVC